MLYSRPVISWSTETKKDTRTEVRERFDSQATVDSTPSPSPWKNVTDCTTVPHTSSRLLMILLVLVCLPSTASRPHPSRPLPPKSVARGTTQSTAIASRNQRLGCSDLALPVKTNWISYLATSLAFLPVSNITRFILSIGKRRLASRNKLLNGLPNVPLRLAAFLHGFWFHARLHI
jgi:hypothetical protein